jgi:hypothetical protein
MNLEEQNNYKRSENEINTVYQKILKEYSSDNDFIKNLKTSQRLWIQFRDAELKARYPESGQYGSTFSMCGYIFLTKMTDERIAQLRVWMDGILEGDVCMGSVKMKEDVDVVRDPIQTHNGQSTSNLKSFGVKVLNIPAQSFEDDFKENAKIAIDIVTDASGKVISATYQPRGSTTSDPQMVSIARKRAFELKVGSGDSPQRGTIIFNFKARS